jgi:hypothetical protein
MHANVSASEPMFLRCVRPSLVDLNVWTPTSSFRAFYSEVISFEIAYVKLSYDLGSCMFLPC